jgi:endonuclease/exonuclease/phosphatase family metal-dependent hydrolase
VKNAVLARDPWRISSVRLARFAGARRWYPRGALVAQVGSDVGHLWALSVHLGLGGGERAHQVEALIDLVASLAGTPVVLAGDLNATPDKRAVSRLAATLRDAWAEAGEGEGATFPAIAPVARIDYVFVGEAFEITQACIGTGVASDHIPVVVDLAFAGT